MRYMVAVTLLKGDWPEMNDYDDESEWANDPAVHELRAKMAMQEDPQLTRNYHNSEVRQGGSSITVTMEDGTVLEEVIVDMPMGHPWREDTISRVRTKFIELSSRTVLTDPAKV